MDDSSESCPRSRLQPSDIAVALIIGCCLAVLAMLYGGPSSGDDTFIYMRYVANWLAGHGFVYNVGESSYGTTSLLWPTVMAPIVALFDNELAVWKDSGLVLFGARAFLVVLIMRRWNLRWGPTLGLSALALMEPHTFRWSSSGMENALAAFLVTAFFWVLLDWAARPSNGRSMLAGILLGLLPFARPEFAIFSLAVAMAGFHLPSIGQKDRNLFLATWITTGIAGLLAARYLTGFWLPQSGSAKGIFLHQLEPFYAVKQTIRIVVSGALGGILALGGWRLRPSAIRTLAIGTGTLLLVTGGYLIARNHLISTRYATVLCVPLLLLAAMAGATNWGKKRRVLCMGIVLQSIVFTISLLLAFPATRIDEEAQIQPLARETRELAGPGARVAISEIGVFGFTFDGYLVDLVGLVDPQTVNWGRNHGRLLETNDLEDLLLERKATHFMETFGKRAPLDGERLNFILLREWEVKRTNLAEKHRGGDTWRLYRLGQTDPGRNSDSTK